MIQFMRSTSSAAASQAPLLQAGQPFYETDTHKLKIGDGSTAWNDLPYIGGSGSISSDAKVIKIGVSSHNDYDVDAMDYNCDGTDDQEQFSEAISRLYSTGGTILVYPGNYYFSANLDTSYFSNSIIDIVGLGNAVFRNGQMASNDPILTLSNRTRVQNCSFIAESASCNCLIDGISDRQFNNDDTGIVIRNCYFEANVAKSFIEINSEMVIDSCTFLAYDSSAIDIRLSFSPVGHAIITNNLFSSKTTTTSTNGVIDYYGTRVDSLEDAPKCLTIVSNNVVRDVAMFINSPANSMIVSNNTISTNGSAAINIWKQQSQGANANKYGIVVSNNYIVAHGSSSDDAITIGTDRSSCCGNVVVGTGGGISITGNYSIVSGNTISGEIDDRTSNSIIGQNVTNSGT